VLGSFALAFYAFFKNFCVVVILLILSILKPDYKACVVTALFVLTLPSPALFCFGLFYADLSFCVVS
jgi:hypothetical protein